MNLARPTRHYDSSDESRGNIFEELLKTVQGDTIDELRQNADDAIRCHFGNTKPRPKIKLHFDDEESRPA